MDQHSESNTPVGSTMNAGAVTPTEDNEIIISCASIGSGTTLSVDSGFTLVPNQAAYVGGNHVAIACAYKVQTTAMTEDPQWSWSGSGGGVAFNLTIKHN